MAVRGQGVVATLLALEVAVVRECQPQGQTHTPSPQLALLLEVELSHLVEPRIYEPRCEKTSLRGF